MADLENFFKDIGEFFKEFGKIKTFFEDLGNGVKKVGEGAGEEVVSIGKAWWDLMITNSYIVVYTIEFIWTNLVCSVYFIKNFFSMDCSVWYILRLICCILYGLTFGIVFLIIQFISGMDLEKVLWSNINYFESVVGFKITEFPNVVLVKCFNCKRLKVTEFVDTWKYYLVTGKNGRPSDVQLIVTESVQGFITMADGFGLIINAFK